MYVCMYVCMYIIAHVNIASNMHVNFPILDHHWNLKPASSIDKRILIKSVFGSVVTVVF